MMNSSGEIVTPFNRYRAEKPICLDDKIVFSWNENGKINYRCIGIEPLKPTEAMDIQDNNFSRPTITCGFDKFQTRIVDGIFISTWVSGVGCE